MSTKPENNEGVHRLVDMVVEEVSLVDRAANKHRFLIVKRSNEMDDSTTGAGTETAQDETTSAQTEETAEQTGAETETTTEDTGALDVALGALEQLTGLVEQLGSTDAEATRAAIPDLAAELQSAADQLVTLAGGEQSETPIPAADGDLADVVSAVRETLQQVASLMEGARKTEAPAPAPAPAPAAPELATLAAEVRALAGTVREQQQRLSRLEKRSGLPNSTPPGEAPRRAEPEDVSWPFDLNHRCDREAVDKSVSFYE